MIASLPSSVPKAMRVPSGDARAPAVRAGREFQPLDASLSIGQGDVPR